MTRPDAITMGMRELDRCKVIEAVVRDGLMVWRAAEKLGISRRQVERLAQRYRQDGPQGLLSRRWGQPGHNQLPPGVEARARGLIRDSYADFGPTLAAEKLRERHGIYLAKETVRRTMIDAGFWVPKKQRPPKVHQPRNRRTCLGELVQIDGSDHAWFEDRAPACTLLVYVDDATGRLMQLLFVPTESTQAYFTATRAYLADFNARFAKVPRRDFDAHRPLRGDEELARIFSWREWRKVSQSLTLQYAKVLYLLEDLPEHRRLIHRHIEVAEYPDGRIELWADGTSLPYTTYDRFPEIDQGAIVENKRLAHALAIAAEVQSLRDNRRFGGPSRTLHGEPPRPTTVPLNVKRQRLVNRLDLERAMQHHPLSAANDDSTEDPPRPPAA